MIKYSKFYTFLTNTYFIFLVLDLTRYGISDFIRNFNDANRLIKLQGYKLSELIIGDNCWIGAGCIILPGVHIQDNAVIAVGTIISKNVPKNYVIRNRLSRIDLKKSER